MNKDQGEFIEEIKLTLDEWEEKLKEWYVQKLPDMLEFLGQIQTRMEEFIDTIKDRFPEEPDVEPPPEEE